MLTPRYGQLSDSTQQHRKLHNASAAVIAAWAVGLTCGEAGVRHNLFWGKGDV